MTHGKPQSFHSVGTLPHVHISSDPHGHDTGSHAAHGPEGNDQRGAQITDGEISFEKQKMDDVESLHQHRGMEDSAAAQIIGVFILEFGVILHRYVVILLWPP